MTPRRRRGALATMAGVALAAAAVVIAIHRPPPPGPADILSGPGGQATCSAAFSPGGKVLSVASCHDSVILWDVAARRWIATLVSPRCPDGWQVVFSPDGQMLAMFSGSGPAAREIAQGHLARQRGGLRVILSDRRLAGLTGVTAVSICSMGRCRWPCPSLSAPARMARH